MDVMIILKLKAVALAHVHSTLPLPSHGVPSLWSPSSYRLSCCIASLENCRSSITPPIFDTGRKRGIE
jgi:hypothetical protein